MTVATQVKTSPWVDVTVHHKGHNVEFHSHGDIVLRFENKAMFDREFLHLSPNETKKLDVHHDGECPYYVYQLAPPLSSEDYSLLAPQPTKMMTMMSSSNSIPRGPIITP